MNDLKYVFVTFNLSENLCDKPGPGKIIEQISSIAGEVELG